MSNQLHHPIVLRDVWQLFLPNGLTFPGRMIASAISECKGLMALSLHWRVVRGLVGTHSLDEWQMQWTSVDDDTGARHAQSPRKIYSRRPPIVRELSFCRLEYQ